MPNPTAAMLVIGDEILSGRTRDANLHHLAGVFAAAGITLKEARVISDDPSAIVAAAFELDGNGGAVTQFSIEAIKEARIVEVIIQVFLGNGNVFYIVGAIQNVG